MIRRTRFSALVVAVAITVLYTSVASSPQKQSLSISMRALPISTGERVVGFDFDVTSGRIAQIQNAPIGWNISVDNDPSWNTRIEGSIIVVAAAVDASFFEDFLVVEKDESLGNPFGIQGEVIVSKDFSNVRRIRIEQKDFTIKERETLRGTKPE
jgi:hypothetical protein